MMFVKGQSKTESLPFNFTCSIPCEIDKQSDMVATTIRRGETYHFGHHISFELEIAPAVPFQVHVKLDALEFGLMNVHAREPDWGGPKVQLDKS